MFRHRILATALGCLIGVGWSGFAGAAPHVVYEEDFSDQPVGSAITSPPASWTKGNPGNTHMGDLVITDATKLGPRAVDGSASTNWYSSAYKEIPSPVTPETYTFTCKAYAPVGADGCGVGFGMGAQCAAAWWYVRLDNEHGAWLFDARGLAGELAKGRKAYLPNWPGFVSRHATEPVLEGGAEQAVRLSIVVDTERHQVWGTVTDEKGRVHKSRAFTTKLDWTNAGISRSGERVNSVVIWQHNVLKNLPQIDVGAIRVTSEVVLPKLTQAELAMKRPFAVIHHGWITPDTKYLHDNLADMEKLPFDGFSINIAYPRDERGAVYFNPKAYGWRAFENTRFTPREIEPAIQDIQALRSDKLRHNYISLASLLQPDANMNWFDDAWWDNIANNIRLVARVAKQGGFDGLMLDTEEYHPGYIWTFSGERGTPLAKDPRYAGVRYEDVAAMARRRGREFAKAVNSEYPGIHILSLHAWETLLYYTPLTAQGKVDKDRLPFLHLSLFVPFMDGVLEGSDEKTVLIDGIEGGYGCETLSDFLAKARRLRRDGPKLSAVPDLFRKKVRAGFGIYMDTGGYDADHPEKSHWTPERLTNAVANALIAADGPVWLWNQKPCWLLDSSEARLGGGIEFDSAKHQYVPPVYWEAIEKGRKHAREFIASQRQRPLKYEETE